MDSSRKKSFWALMIAQFFGAFNDNVFKVLVTLLIVQWVHDEIVRAQLVDLSGAVFVAPFLLFSMVAGRLADRVPKPQVVVGTKLWELLVVSVAILSMWLHSIFFMMTGLFLLAMQAAFFGPAKYGLLPELMDESELSRANGWFNMGTFAAILMGTIVASMLSMRLAVASGIMLAASLVGLAGSLFIQYIPAAKPEEAWAFNPFRDLAANWRLLKPDRVLKSSIIAVNYFWFIGAVFQLNIFLYAKEMIGASDKVSGGLVCALMIGVVLGSFIAGYLSGEHVELGLVPIGAVGIGFFTIDLLWAHVNMIRLIVDLFLLGISAGFYDIPLTAMVQWRSPKGERGRVLATMNFFSFVAILSASGVLWIMHAVIELNSAQVFFALGLFSLAVAVVLCCVFPETRQRLKIVLASWSQLKRQPS